MAVTIDMFPAKILWADNIAYYPKCRLHVEINIILNAKKIFAGTDATKERLK